MSEKANSFLEELPLGTLMRKYSLPCIISLLVGALYNIVDQIFIANADYLGSNGNAANTVVYPLTVVALAIAVMIGDGTCTFVSISLGAKRSEQAKNAVGSAIVTTILSSVVLMVIYLVFMEPILTFFGGAVNESTFAFAKEYFFWITVGVPAYMFGQAMNPIIRSDGSPKFAMIASTLGAITNVIMDPVLIYGAHWGMMGAAVATVMGQVLTAVLSIWYLAHMKTMKLDKECFRIHFDLVKKYIPLGITSFLSQASLVVSMAATNNMIQKYSVLDPIYGQAQYTQIPMAVFGIVMKYFQIVISVSVGAAAGCAPIAGYNTGAGRNDRVKELFTKLLILEGCVGIVALLIAEFLPNQIMALFGAAQESQYYIDFALKCFRIYLCLIPLATINKGTFIYLQSLGKAKESTAISMIREIIFGVGFVLLIPMYFALNGVLYSMPVADLLTFVIAVVFIAKVYKELDAKIATTDTVQQTLEQPVSESIASDGKVIVIGRSFGSGGRTIGKAVADKLGIPYYDKEILDQMAKDGGFKNTKYFEEIDEKPIQSTIANGAFLSDAPFESMESIAIQLQRSAIENIASKGACVIVGRHADSYVPKDRLLSVFITSNIEDRKARVSMREGISETESLRKIEKVDKERASYYNSISDKNWGEASTYDLCLDSSKFGMEGTVNLIVEVASLS